MIKRRLAFATPFVLVVGCRAPAPASPGEAERTRREEAPVVVAIEEPGDAAVPAADLNLEAAAGIRHEVPPDEDPDYGRYKCCVNPPPPKLPKEPLPPERKPTGNPPRPMRVRIVKYEVMDSATVITIAAGTEHGIDPKRNPADVVDESERPIKGGAVQLIRCNKTSCIGRVKLTPDQINKAPFVRVSWD